MCSYIWIEPFYDIEKSLRGRVRVVWRKRTQRFLDVCIYGRASLERNGTTINNSHFFCPTNACGILHTWPLDCFRTFP